MFSRISFKSAPDQFLLTLSFGHAGRRGKSGEEAGTVSIEWSGLEGEATVLEKVAVACSDPALLDESVCAQLEVAPDADAPNWGVVAASTFHKDVELRLEVRSAKPTLVAVELLRTAGGSGGLPMPLAQALWSALELSYVQRVRATDGVGALMDEEVLGRLGVLRVLNLSHSGMASLPAEVGLLGGLEELRLVGNRLKMLPKELGLLRQLRILAADANEIVILPGELRHCTNLEELTLENNRLGSVLLNFSTFPKLQVLHLYSNPLEFLPEISPCQSLRHLSVANLRVTADPEYTKFKVELLPTSGGGGSGISLFGDGKQQDKLRPIFSLMLRRSSGHHPLLAGALRQVAEQDPKNRELMAGQENALQQLVLMALNDNPVVVTQTCATLSLLAAHSPELAELVVENDVSSVMDLLSSPDEDVQLSSLRVLAAAAFQSQVASVKILTDKVLRAVEGLILGEGTPARLREAALESLGNLAFAPGNRIRLQGRVPLMQRVMQLAQTEAGGPRGRVRVKAAAVRVLAVLGENDAVWRAVGRRPLISERGVRILSMDGGGMKGIATVKLLRELELRTGRRIQEMFDLLVGTSTGGLLAVALGLRNFTLDDCDRIYKVLGQKVFSRPLAKQDKEETWMESFYRTFHSKTQHVRAVVVGYKHDATVYEGLLKEYCDFSKEAGCISDSMIDTACLDVPKVALVSTLASITPAFPFIFRNYELPPASQELARQIRAHDGSSKHKVWQAVRASSAATYYLDDYSCWGDKFQDGAVVANNPAILALQEARLLWPGAPIDVVISLGSGSTPSSRRDRAMSSFMETGSILIESACGVERPAEALATLMPLIPGVRYWRFTPLDARCGMELDEIEPARWEELEAATRDYISAEADSLDAAAWALSEGLGMKRPAIAAAPPAPTSALAALRLGPSRRLTLLTSSSPATGAGQGVEQALAGLATAVVDVQRREIRARGQPVRVHQQPLQVGVSQTAVRSGTPTAQEQAGDHSVAQGAAEPKGGSAAEDGQPSTESEQGSGWFSWFSPRKQPLLPPSSSTTVAERAEGGAASGPSQAAGVRQLQHGAGQLAGDAPKAFMTLSFAGKPAARTGPASHGATQASLAAGARSNASKGASNGQAAPAVGAVAVGAAPASSQSGTATHAAQQPGAAAPEGAVEFVSRQLRSLLVVGSGGHDEAEVGACHLDLAPAGEGLVLSWRQAAEAVLEPSDMASSLLSQLGLDPSAASLSQIFERQHSIPLPLHCSSSGDGGGQGPGQASTCGSLALLSQHQQWVAGQQLRVLLLQSSLPGELLTEDMLEGQLLQGTFSQQLVGCASDLTSSMLHTLLGVAGAAAVVCPRVPGVDGSSPEQVGVSRAGSAAGVARCSSGSEEGDLAFFHAFYAALKGGATLRAALGAAEAAQPGVAGKYAAYGMHGSELVAVQ